MKQIIKKVLSIYMISTLVLSMLLSSLQRVSADESENIPNSPIKVLEENISDQSLYIKYYMTIDNQKFLYIENSKIVNGDWVTNTLKTKVDENNNLIKSTKEEYQTNYHISDESIDNIDNNVMAHSTTSSWKKHTEKFSLSKTKLTVAAVSILLIAATGIGASDAAVVALNLVSYCINHSMNIPSYIYFKGLRCVSRSSVGKVYFRYKGKLYYDSKFKKQIVNKTLTWSRRWGH